MAVRRPGAGDEPNDIDKREEREGPLNPQSIQQALSALGLTYGATKEEIKQAFHHLAVAYHPDVNGEAGATEYYLYVRSAYEYLMALPEVPTAPNAPAGGDANATDATPGVRYYGNVAVSTPSGTAYAGAGDGGWANPAGGSRIIGSRESLSQAATRRKFKEEHRRQEDRLKMREEQRRKEAEERLEAERRQRIFDEAMARIHAIRAAEITANIIEDILQNGNRGK